MGVPCDFFPTKTTNRACRRHVKPGAQPCWQHRKALHRRYAATATVTGTPLAGLVRNDWIVTTDRQLTSLIGETKTNELIEHTPNRNCQPLADLACVLLHARAELTSANASALEAFLPSKKSVVPRMVVRTIITQATTRFPAEPRTIARTVQVVGIFSCLLNGLDLATRWAMTHSRRPGEAACRGSAG